jgi:hypothetical protein
MKTQGTIKYPKFLEESAEIIGRLRNITNLELNEEHSKYNRGGNSDELNINGVLGEMIFSYYLQSINVDHTMGRLLSNKPQTSWDIKVKDKKIDVKTFKKDSKLFLVNQESHNKTAKEIDYYVMIQLKDNQSATYDIFKKEEVDEWPVKDMGYQTAHARYINI